MVKAICGERSRTIRQCRLCGNTTLVPVVSLGEQVLGGVFPRVREEKVGRGPLELVKCFSGNSKECCGLAQLRHSYDPDELYGSRYEYRSGVSRVMAAHLRRKVKRVIRSFPVEAGDVIVDVGSNDGTLLNAYPKGRFFLLGIDPTITKLQSYYSPSIRLMADFFSSAAVKERLGGKRAKVVTSIAMLYDLESPLDFARQVYDILDDEGVWIFEQGYLPSMMRQGVYDAVCHEHLEYYALRQIKWMMDSSDFKIVDLELNDINGGSLSVTAAKRNSSFCENNALIEKFLDEEGRQELESMVPYQEYAKRVYRHREMFRAAIRDIRSQGKTIAGYGASTKGNVLLQFCGLTADDLLFIAEINGDKCGYFTPGTLIPIVPEEEIRSAAPDYLLVLPWHLREDFLKRQRAFLGRGGGALFPFPEIEIVLKK